VSAHAAIYVLGFALVWAAIALVWAGVAGYRHFDRDWDRAFQRELAGLSTELTKER
jgi:hypothetical protein